MLILIGSNAFCLNGTKLFCVKIPVEKLIENSLKHNLVLQAYELLSIDRNTNINKSTKLDVAFAALQSFSFDVSKKIFEDLNEDQHLKFLNHIQVCNLSQKLHAQLSIGKGF